MNLISIDDALLIPCCWLPWHCHSLQICVYCVGCWCGQLKHWNPVVSVVLGSQSLSWRPSHSNLQHSHTGLHPSVRIIGLTNIYFHFYVHTKINIDIIEKWLKVTKCRSRNTFVNSWTHFFMLKIISITFSTWIFVTTISLPRDLRDLFYRLSSWATTYAELSH